TPPRCCAVIMKISAGRKRTEGPPNKSTNLHVTGRPARLPSGQLCSRLDCPLLLGRSRGHPGPPTVRGLSAVLFFRAGERGADRHRHAPCPCTNRQASITLTCCPDP